MGYKILFIFGIFLMLSSCSKTMQIKPEAEVKNLIPRELAVQYLNKMYDQSMSHLATMPCDFQLDILRGWDLFWYESNYRDLSYKIIKNPFDNYIIRIYRKIQFCQFLYDTDDLPYEELQKIITAFESLGMKKR